MIAVLFCCKVIQIILEGFSSCLAMVEVVFQFREDALSNGLSLRPTNFARVLALPRQTFTSQSRQETNDVHRHGKIGKF